MDTQTPCLQTEKLEAWDLLVEALQRMIFPNKIKRPGASVIKMPE